MRSIRLVVVSDKCFEGNAGMTVAHVIMFQRLYHARDKIKQTNKNKDTQTWTLPWFTDNPIGHIW